MARLYYKSTDVITLAAGGPTSNANFTFFDMIKPESFAAAQFVVYLGTGVNAGNGYGINLAANTGELGMDISFVVNITSGLRAKLKKWNRIVVKRAAAGTRWILYMNGQKSVQSATNNSFAPTGRYTFGARPNSSGTMFNPAVGSLGEFAFWTAALSDAECLALSLGTKKPFNLSRRTGILTQYHPLTGKGATERGMVGANMSVTGTLPSPHPVAV